MTARPSPSASSSPARRVLLRGEMREVVLGDLDEEFALAIAAGADRRQARRRYWRQAFASIVSTWRVPRATSAASTPDRGPLRRAVQGLALDLRHAARVLARSPGFTLVAVGSLAIGIGANTAMYNVVRALLVESLPVTRPDELALAYWTRPPSTKVRMLELNSDNVPRSEIRPASPEQPHVFDVRGDARRVRRVSPDLRLQLHRPGQRVDRGQPPMPAGGMLATSEYFPVMGLAMAAGRPFAAADDRPDAARVVVISYGLWMRAFGGDRSAIGRTIRVSGTPCEVIGVTAQGYRGLSQGGFFPPVDVTLPMAAQPDVMPRWSAMPASGASLFTSNQFWVRAIVRVPAGTNGSEGALASALRARIREASRSHAGRDSASDGPIAAGRARARLASQGHGASARDPWRGRGRRAADGVRQPCRADARERRGAAA